MMKRQINLDMRSAQRNKKDEFYTQIEDIEKELVHYKNQFKNKIVYCPCDNEKSSFFQFFHQNFDELGLKKLICTGFSQDGPDKIIIQNKDYTSFKPSDRPCDLFSDHLRHFFNECDIVVTNPPFSRFREFMTMLIEMKKDFLVIGNMNSILTKDLFKYIVSGDLFWGVSIHSGDRLFEVPDDYPLESSGFEIKRDKKFIKVKGVRWFTNLRPDNKADMPYLNLTCSVKNKEYEKFNHIDAICVNKTSEIPYDYDGLMGVPLTFFDKYNPDQFEIIDGVNRYLVLDALKINDEAVRNKYHLLSVGDQIKFFRILIKRKH